MVRQVCQGGGEGKDRRISRLILSHVVLLLLQRLRTPASMYCAGTMLQQRFRSRLRLLCSLGRVYSKYILSSVVWGCQYTVVKGNLSSGVGAALWNDTGSTVIQFMLTGNDLGERKKKINTPLVFFFKRRKSSEYSQIDGDFWENVGVYLLQVSLYFCVSFERSFSDWVDVWLYV